MIVSDERYLFFYERKNPYRRMTVDLPDVLDIFPLPLQIYFLSSHSDLCPRNLISMDYIEGCPCSLTSGWANTIGSLRKTFLELRNLFFSLRLLEINSSLCQRQLSLKPSLLFVPPHYSLPPFCGVSPVCCGSLHSAHCFVNFIKASSDHLIL